MKKIISLALVIATLALLLCACGTNVKVERGEVSGDTYTNESIDMVFKAPSGWTFYTDDQLAELMNITKDVLKDKDLIESGQLASITEFMAIDDNGNNVNMTIAKLGLSDMVKSIEDCADEVKDALREQELQYTFGEDDTAELGGTEFFKITAACQYMSINMNQYIYINKFGNYVVTITATSLSNISAGTFEAMFS